MLLIEHRFFIIKMKKILLTPETDGYIRAFQIKYPELYRGQSPDFYQNKCSIISILFAEMLIEEFKKKNIKGLWGFKEGWKARGISHVVILMEGYTYDLTHAQVSRDQPVVSLFEIAKENDWRENYVEVEERYIDLDYCKSYKKNWKEKIMNLKETDPEKFVIGKQHLDDLTRFGYI